MENSEKEMSYEESLALIQSMIDAARNKVAEDGFHLILWGVLVIACSIINYALLKTSYAHLGPIAWMAMPFIGVPIAIYYEKRLKAAGHVKTHLDTYVAYMWWSYGITLFIAIAYSVSSQVSPVPYILMITGLVTFATGLMLKFKPLVAGGVLFWIFTVVCFFFSPVDHLMIEAIAIFLGYIVPGILLRKEAKAQANV